MAEMEAPSPTEENSSINVNPTQAEENSTLHQDTTSPLESKIIRQVEYYFGNFNLIKDRFLREQMKLNDGWVPMETMLKFNRLKELSSDSSVVTEALKKSPNKLLEVNEDGSQIRRSVQKPLPENQEDHMTEINSRSIYAKGFTSDTKLDELIEFFKDFGNVENVQMRRRPNKAFKGSVFATFTTGEDAQKFLACNTIKFKGREILKETKAGYLKRKKGIFEERRKQKECKKRNLEEKEGDKNGGDGESNAKVEKVEGNEQDSEIEITKGCLLKLTGLSEGTMWEHIKDVLKPHGRVSFVEYSKGLPQAIVRFESPVAAEVLAKVGTDEDGQKKIKINAVDSIGTVIEGQEEIDFWKNLKKSQSASREKKSEREKFRKGRQNRGGRGGRGRYNHRNRDGKK